MVIVKFMVPNQCVDNQNASIGSVSYMFFLIYVMCIAEYLWQGCIPSNHRTHMIVAAVKISLFYKSYQIKDRIIEEIPS